MDEKTLLEIINGLRNQIADIRGNMREQHKQEIERIELDYENEKNLIEQKFQEEIGGYKYAISQQKIELEYLERDNKEKDNKIREIEKTLIDKEGEIQTKLQELKTKTKDYDFLKNNYDDKIKELGSLNKKLIEKDEEHNKYINELSIPIQDKGNYDKVENIKNKMSEEQQKYAIETMQNGFKMYDKPFKVAQYVKGQFESKYGGKWSVSLVPSGYGGSCSNYFDKCLISFEIGEFTVKIAKTGLGDESIRLHDKGNYSKVDIVNTKIIEEQKNYAIETTRKALNMYQKHLDAAEYIKNEFDKKYHGNWCVILMPSTYGDSYFNFFDDCYISFKMGEFTVNIAKTGLGDESIRLLDKGNYNKVDLIGNKLRKEINNYAIEIMRKSLNMYDDHFKVVDYVKAQFDLKYGGQWCVCIRPCNYGSSQYSYYNDYVIKFRMGEFYVVIFKETDN